jgi:hypothetical protein
MTSRGRVVGQAVIYRVGAKMNNAYFRHGELPMRVLSGYIGG